MSSKECEEQLKRLIYDWETEGLLTKINATDIEAIKHLMLENQMQQKEIKGYQAMYFDKVMIINKAIEYIEKYNVFKEFYFPLMKRDEENQVKSSIKYEFDTSIKKNLLEILKEDNKEE